MIATILGKPFMPHQQYIADVALEVQSEAAGDPSPGDWAYDDVRVSVERQAGKTTLLRPVMVHRCGTPKARIFMTAQTGRKARSRWMDATDDILSSAYRDEVRRKISHSFEELRWRKTQSLILPFAPNEDDMHGETPDMVSVDEQWAFDHDQARKVQAAYVPGFLTKNAQAWKLSTAGTDKSWWLNADRKSGRRAVETGVRLGIAYFEHSLPDLWNGVAIDDLTDAELVQACIDNHPATGHMLRPSALWSAWESMGHDRAEFLRAYGNRTAEDIASKWRAMDAGEFLRAASLDTIPADARVSLGIDVDPDMVDAAVTSGYRGEDGRMLTEQIKHDAGASWVLAYVIGVIERQDIGAVAILNTGPARDIADQLEKALADLEKPVELLRMSETDYAAACSRHKREQREKSWLHRGEKALATAAEHAVPRRVGAKGRAWDKAEGGPSVAALGSNTLAGWACDHAPAPEPKTPFWMG